MRLALPFAVLFAICGLRCYADAVVIAPTSVGPIGGPTEVGTIFPFLILQTDPFPNPVLTTRYQQVYNRSLFTNLPSNLIYVTTMIFSTYPPTNSVPSWTVPKMQINLSTTSNAADGLSLVFNENVGTDDTVVFGPSSWFFSADPDSYFIQFTRPFRYDPSRGNLLLDVRILDSGPPPPVYYIRAQWGYSNSTDEVSRVWSTNVNATTATAADTTGLRTLIAMSPIPSLRAEFDPSLCGGCPSNLVLIRWPPQPTNFVLQTRPGPSASWQAATNQVLGSPDPYRGGWSIEIQRDSANPTGFYRLFWSGQ